MLFTPLPPAKQAAKKTAEDGRTEIAPETMPCIKAGGRKDSRGRPYGNCVRNDALYQNKRQKRQPRTAAQKFASRARRTGSALFPLPPAK